MVFLFLNLLDFIHVPKQDGLLSLSVLLFLSHVHVKVMLIKNTEFRNKVSLPRWAEESVEGCTEPAHHPPAHHRACEARPGAVSVSRLPTPTQSLPWEQGYSRIRFLLRQELLYWHKDCLSPSHKRHSLCFTCDPVPPSVCDTRPGSSPALLEARPQADSPLQLQLLPQ